MLRSLPLVLLLLWLLSAVWLSLKRLPPGVHIDGAWQALPARSPRFLRDSERR